jgi:hypothetical protein
MKTHSFIIALCLLAIQTNAQHNHQFHDGYALRYYTDTIKCKILYDFQHPFVFDKVTLMIADDQVTFQAGGIITGFGIYGDSTDHHYGFVSTNEISGKINVGRDVFLRKIVAGPVSIYINEYRTTTTKRNSFDTPIDKPISTTTSSNTSYYISKTDPDKPVLAKAVSFAPYRKKDLEKYLKDNKELYDSASNNLTLQETISLVQKYNTWALSQKK